MSTTVSFNGVSYEVPETGETSWGEAVSNLLVALATFAATSSSQRAAVRVATTSPVTVASNDYTVVVRRSVAGATTVNLPAGTTGQLYAIVDGAGDAATNNITIVPSGSETIVGAANYVINANGGAVLLQYNTTNTRWEVLSDAQGLLTNADIAANAGIAFSKLAALSDGAVLMGNPSNVPAAYIIDGDVFVGPGATSAIRPNVIVDADVNASAAIAASKLANTPSGNLAATTVQGALNELQTDVDTRATSAALASHIATTSTHGVSGAVVGTTDSQALTNKTFNDTSNVALVGGNSRGGPMRLGTNDAGSLLLETNGVDRLQILDTANLGTADAALLGTGGLLLSAGTTAQRPGSALNGTIRFNTDTSEFEGRASGSWQSVGGGLNERPEKNYLKAYAAAKVAPGTLSLLASSSANLVSLTAFYANTASGASALTQSSSTALRGSFNYLSALVSASTAGATFFQFPAFALEGTDLGKPVSIAFDVNSTLTDGDWDVVVVRYNSSGVFQELIPVAGNASASSVTPSSKVMGGTGTQRGFFVAGSTAGDLYALRFRRLVGSVQLRLDTLYVGPQAQLAGAAVTGVQAYTPTLQGFGTVSNVDVYWNQVGEYVFCYGSFTSGTPTAVEARIGLPNSLIQATESSSKVRGRVYRNVGTATTRKQYTAVSTVGQSYMRVGSDDYTNASFPTDALNGNAVTGGAETIVFEFWARVATYSSSVTMAERAVEEYASNSDTADADDLSSFAYGINGSAVPTLALATSGARTKRVRFQTPIQPTDLLQIEVQVAGTDKWLTDRASVDVANTALYGIYINGIASNGTDVNVNFGRAGLTAFGAATYGATGEAWTSISRWRIRKTSGGAAVGFPVGARNVVGDTSGTAVPAGMIGENQTAQNTAGTTLAIAGTTVGTVTLSAGVWLLSATMNVVGATAGDLCAVYWNGVTGTLADIARGDAGNASGRLVLAARPRVVMPTASTAYTLGGENQSGNRGTAYTTIVAIRIA